MPDLKFCAHYPFSSEARSYAKEEGIRLDANSINGGKERLRQGLQDGRLKLIATELEVDLQNHISYYAASRAILAAWANNYAKRRMAVAESKAASDYLKSSPDRAAEYPQKLATSLGISFFPAKQEEGGEEKGKFLIPFWQYLAYAPQDIHFKLSNMELSQGFVKISQAQKVRIIEEAVRKRLEEAPLPKIKEVPKEISQAISGLAQYIPKENLQPLKIDAKDFPPCIKKMLDDMFNSINVPHSGRVALAIYLIRAGLDDDKINSIFANAPDYSAETSLYQISFIRKKGYLMPSCKTMDTYGLCMAECRCNNPVNFRSEVHGKFARQTMVGEKKGDGIDV